MQLVLGGLRIRALAESAPFVRDQAAVRETQLPAGASITVGTTVLSVVVQPVADANRLPRIERTDARTLLHGAAIDVKGLAAITALMTALDDAKDRRAAEEALTAMVPAARRRARCRASPRERSRGLGRM